MPLEAFEENKYKVLDDLCGHNFRIIDETRYKDIKTQIEDLQRKFVIVYVDKVPMPRWLSSRFRLRGRKVPGSKPDSTEDPPCMVSCTLNHTWEVNCPPALVVQKFKEESAILGLALVF
ncbi:hypothetical protein AVEN_174556-1 [Araneus ventricosus]|uniref:Uncharacterized protein n=1 Tax=Araneus ventricosus TaxID=182803 RepID=A0A4Y2KDN6_ARAVE|nr:hypothetical protein AVEN_174556-1 [Araneus ventricosus]